MKTLNTRLTRTDLNRQIRTARDAAKAEAETHYRFIRSRGVDVCIIVNGNRVNECLEHLCAGSYPTAYEYSELEAIAATHLTPGGANHVELYFDGGYDGADSMDDLQYNYEPWCSEWQVLAVEWNAPAEAIA